MPQLKGSLAGCGHCYQVPPPEICEPEANCPHDGVVTRYVRLLYRGDCFICTGVKKDLKSAEFEYLDRLKSDFLKENSGMWKHPWLVEAADRASQASKKAADRENKGHSTGQAGTPSMYLPMPLVEVPRVTNGPFYRFRWVPRRIIKKGLRKDMKDWAISVAGLETRFADPFAYQSGYSPHNTTFGKTASTLF
ncbi:hypothetical protein DM02DRAFT_656315 [Periconia macrospinosa]|uniref:Uncharacterized protein n=1 Tax=Periconia macrospinosa TaxID=97972 RepID=A0A2V1DNZ7_9PLEO|nr:hypothetical protein DM02DRAFT_656315 [Periconia macrospinosa]